MGAYLYDDFDDNSLDARWSEWSGTSGAGGSLTEQNQRIEAGVNGRAGPPAAAYQGFNADIGESWDSYTKVTLDAPTVSDYVYGGPVHQNLTGNGYVRVFLYYFSPTTYRIQYDAYDGVNNDNQQQVKNISNEYVWFRTRYIPGEGDTFIRSFYSETEPTADEDWTEISYPTASPVPDPADVTEVGMYRYNTDFGVDHAFYFDFWNQWGVGSGASSGVAATLDGEAVEIAGQIIERYSDYIVYIDSSQNLKIKRSDPSDVIATGAEHL